MLSRSTRPTMVRSAAVSLVLAAAFVMVEPARADPILDQVALPDSCCLSFGLAVVPTQSVSQSFIAGVSGTLISVDVSIFQDAGATGNVVFHLLRDPFDFRTSIYSAIIPLTVVPIGSGQFVSVDVSAAQIVLDAGDDLAIGLSRPTGAHNRPWVIWNSANYDRGSAFSTVTGPHPQGDVAFRTHMDPVPEPATLLLVGIGVAAASVGRSFRRSTGP